MKQWGRVNDYRIFMFGRIIHLSECNLVYNWTLYEQNQIYHSKQDQRFGALCMSWLRVFALVCLVRGWRNLRQRTGGSLVFSDLAVMLKQFLFSCWMFFSPPPFICLSVHLSCFLWIKCIFHRWLQNLPFTWQQYNLGERGMTEIFYFILFIFLYILLQ